MDVRGTQRGEHKGGLGLIGRHNPLAPELDWPESSGHVSGPKERPHYAVASGFRSSCGELRSCQAVCVCVCACVCACACVCVLRVDAPDAIALSSPNPNRFPEQIVQEN